MRRLWIALTALTLGLALFSGAASAQVDPAELARRLNDAINRRDVAAAQALVTDDFVQENPPTCAPCVGKEALREDIQRRAAIDNLITPLGFQVSGNNATGGVEVRANVLDAAGVERVIANVAVEIRGDKVAAVRVLGFDTNDPQTAAFLAFQQAQAAQAAAPARAGGPTVPLYTAFGLGTALLLAGLAMRRGQRVA